MDREDPWSQYFNETIRFLEELDRQYGLCNNAYIQYALGRLTTCVQTILTLIDRIRSDAGVGLEAVGNSLEELVVSLRRIRRKWVEYQDILDSTSLVTNAAYCVPTLSTGGRGRPKFNVSREQLEYLSSLSFTWTEIAVLIGVSRTTLYRRRADFGMLVDPNTSISDVDLVSFVQNERQRNPAIGESLVTGSLRAQGYYASRNRVRHVLRSSDPLGSALRWSGGITHRRVYSVAGPNSLWHIDSHHKLVRWKMVTQSGIDGYSRLIVFLKCSTNNRSMTMYSLFLKAVHSFHLPSRVRTDQGRENILVAQHMIEHRGADRRSIITGSSVHNQRIERLWRDLHQGVTLLYYRLFYHLEEFGLLDPLNEHHLYSLHFVFIPRINKSLMEFQNAWNYHRIRTVGHKSPYQLFTAGLLLLQRSQLTAFDFFDNVDDMYGIDRDGPESDDVDGTVVVPRLNFQLTPENFHRLSIAIDPLSTSSNYGIDLYEEVLQFIESL